jgi:hypothetical protein
MIGHPRGCNLKRSRSKAFGRIGRGPDRALGRNKRYRDAFGQDQDSDRHRNRLPNHQTGHLTWINVGVLPVPDKANGNSLGGAGDVHR